MFTSLYRRIRGNIIILTRILALFPEDHHIPPMAPLLFLTLRVSESV